MKTIKTYSDAASIAIGSKDLWARIPNGYGDGTFETLIFDDFEDFETHGGKGWRFVTTFEGQRIEVAACDCPECFRRWEPVAVLSGAYSAYYDGTGRIALVRRGDAESGMQYIQPSV